uniref:Nucleolar protein 6 n=1 Tax=Angiostrongylus cantonensis TaxID=6313 RepID=A0A0K0DM64_ANGCA
MLLAKISRFSPNTSNLRISTVYPNIHGKDNESTPLFNQRVLRTLLESDIIRQISTVLLPRKTLISALALASRWFSCRGLLEFDGMFLACFMVHLLNRNVVAEQQDLLTVLRNFFLAIVSWDTSSPTGFYPDDLDSSVVSAHLSAFPVIFLDTTGYFNIASGISMESLLLVKADVAHSLTLLEDYLSFDALFLESHRFYSLFDHYFRLDLSPKCLESLCTISDLLLDTVDENDRIANFTKMFIARIHECMDERFDNVYIQRLQCGKLHLASFLIGFRVGRGWANPITVGPLATDPKAREFRQLWKEKTQLRKFSDARICECMIWADTTSVAVPYSILQFIVANTEQGTIEDGCRVPAQRAIPPYTATVTVHLKLEYSGKWGDTIDGVLHLSAAFYIEDGVAFNLVLVLDKVLKILERRVVEMKSNGASQIEMSLEGQRLEKWKKRWLSVHYMTSAVHDLALEMIVVSVFEDVAQPPPQTSVAAFRRVLELICRHNWTARPLLIDFDNAWDEKEIAKLEENFVKMRPILPPMVIITNEDPTGAKWTREGPTPLLLKRIVGLSESMFAFSNVDVSIYDAVIEVYPKVVVRRGVNDAVKMPRNVDALPVLNFDPVDDFVCALNAHFQHVALFFWNKYGGDRIGIKWKPHEIEVPAKVR